MNDDERQQLESRLTSMRPIVPSVIARERLRVSITRSEARWPRKYQLLSLAAIVLIAIVLGKVLTPARPVTRVAGTGTVASKPLRESAPPPTLAAYQSAAVFDPDKLDALLMRQSACVLPPTPELTMQQR
jgi:hypothetical protein